mmetsp:Transcript_10681/g.15421  ORF Transcript_10681/g.15421 Transcript_10681/m.15421 type:complete len:273 (-) Transcript_10681:164-982(-)|eukprot:CAMPEP_0172422180 /NCGR_PEP_ID=MMETSP1064-20121228/8375_1 /TAXON_ID=202472 /ORGANISM="Aulacoseira subarctica , Strain CCAP 1002/5" /LENGTH=272 /DNA_ID=CAMNT_0013162941 /DNA_START=112 /DNA_END=930 /DNA_ORIENTATION=-
MSAKKKSNKTVAKASNDVAQPAIKRAKSDNLVSNSNSNSNLMHVDSSEDVTNKKGDATSASTGTAVINPKCPNMSSYRTKMKLIAGRIRNFEGWMLVTGIAKDNDDDEDEEEEDEEDDDEEFTAEQIAGLRYIAITTNRARQLEEYDSFANPDDGFFNTSSGNSVIFELPAALKKIMKKVPLADRFDALFGLTSSLTSYDCWLHDNECWGEGGELDASVKQLGNCWKTILRRSDQELGIDAEYTRPGILAMLQKFEETVSQVESVSVKFKYI